MYRYETHLHTSPVSLCAKKTVRETLACYCDLGFDGVFITNHFLDGNISVDPRLPYEEKINFYFSDYEEGLVLGKQMGIKVFFGAELSYYGTDFLVYGLDKQWFLQHPEIMEMRKTEELPYLISHGAMVIQAHPFREADYIDHIRLFPRSVLGVEVQNACRTDFENEMARLYAERYHLLQTAGTDNHMGADQMRFAGMETETPLKDEQDFIERLKTGKMKMFTLQNP